jgi:hypothetical protein
MNVLIKKILTDKTTRSKKGLSGGISPGPIMAPWN